MKPVFIISLFLALLAASCSKDASVELSTDKSGSITRFTVHNGFMYLLNLNEVLTYSLADPDKPQLVHSLPTDYGLETIIIYDNTIYLGSSTSLYILDISNPAAPFIVSKTDRLEFFFGGCDPVVVKDNYAFSTVKIIQNICGTAASQSALVVYDVSNEYAPDQVGMYPMKLPNGLGYKGNYLFVCDEGTDRIEVFNFANPLSLSYLEPYSVSIANPKDLIVSGNKMIVSTKDDFQIFDLSNLPLIQRIAQITK